MDNVRSDLHQGLSKEEVRLKGCLREFDTLIGRPQKREICQSYLTLFKICLISSQDDTILNQSD